MSRLKTGLKRPREVPIYLNDLEREFAIRQMHDFGMKSLTEYFRLARIPAAHEDMVAKLNSIRKKQRGLVLDGIDSMCQDLYKNKKGGFNG